MMDPAFWKDPKKATMAMRSLSFMVSRTKGLDEHDMEHLNALWNEFSFRFDNTVGKRL